MVEITSISVCWRYWDYYQHTAHINAKFFDERLVVTDMEDGDQIIPVDGARLIHCPFAKEGFNKGKAINKAIRVVKEGWIIFHDADIIMPFPLATWNMIFAGMDEENIYGCDRLSVPSFECYQESKDKIGTLGYVDIPHATIMPRFAFDKYGGWVPIGFWQAWHSKHKRLYPENIDHAGDSDVIFAAQWPRKNRVLLPEASVLHLESADKAPLGPGIGTANWHGRSTQPFQPAPQIQFGRSLQIG